VSCFPAPSLKETGEGINLLAMARPTEMEDDVEEGDRFYVQDL